MHAQHEELGPEPDSSARVWTLRDILVPIFRYRRAALVVTSILCAVTVLVVLLLPRRYEAEMTLLVKRERAETIVSPDPGASFQRSDVKEDELNSEVELLKSRDLLEQVAVASGLAPAPAPTKGTATGSERAMLARAVRELSAQLAVTPLRKTTLIKVTYGSTDPALAARVLSELGRLYLDRHVALHRPAGAYEFFSSQADRFKGELTAARSELEAYGRREAVVAADVEENAALRELAEFEATREQTRAQVADLTRRMRELQEASASTPARMATQVKTQDNQQLIALLRPRVLELELKRTEMLEKFTPRYPPLVALEAQLAQAKAALAESERRPITEQTTDGNPTYQWIAGELARVRAERGAALARADAIGESVRLYQQKARELDQKSVVQADLKRAIKSAEDNYLLYQRKQEEARISDALDRTRIANVAIAQTPTIPALPSSGRRLLTLLVGFALSLAAGISATFVLHYFSPYFETPDDVEAVLDLPVLATLRAGE
jgi:uncharacterized protein involved in exopolysaccharide biosynthesis